MIPVTIVIIALHIILAIRLVFFKPEIKSTATEPTLLEIFLAGIGITMLALGKSWISIAIAAGVWMISKYYKRKKISSSE